MKSKLTNKRELGVEASEAIFQAGQRHSFLPSRSFFPSRLRTCLDLYSPIAAQRATNRQAMANQAPAPARLFGRERTVHQILGGGEGN